jgi:hypothetical protein
MSKTAKPRRVGLTKAVECAVKVRVSKLDGQQKTVAKRPKTDKTKADRAK